MAVIYLTTQGATLKRESRRLYVEKDNIELFEIQARQTESVIIFGNIQVSTQALALIGEEGITVTYLYFNGKMKGQFLPPLNKNIDLRLEQYHIVCNENACLEAAKFMLLKKIEAMEEFYRHCRQKSEFANQYEIKRELEETREKIREAEQYDELLGYEGAASRAHFHYYSQLFKGEILFAGRSKHPPEDEANAMLSLGYTLMQNLINGICAASGLDVYAGFLHRPDYARPSITLDILEGFRPVVDKFVLNLANLSIITRKDFREEGNYKFLLNNAALKKYLLNWNNLIYADDNELLKKIVSVTGEVVKYIRNHGLKTEVA
ncbi:MAG: CRISPR-associated endonuclease Cas1 [Ignavibacteria bacterium]